MKNDFATYVAYYNEFAPIVEILNLNYVYFEESADELDDAKRAIWDRYAERYNFFLDELDRLETINRKNWFDVASDKHIVTNSNHPRGAGYRQILYYC